eukprot:jgi/Phyca11/530383/estExt2_fgenesh1_pm.C_PHYCAscaffold_630007
MGNSGSCPVYDGPGGNFVRADVSMNCGACPSATNDSWLIFHLALSFVLVAYVRWSRVTIHNHACNERELPPCFSAEEEQAAARLNTLRAEYSTYLNMLKVGLPRVIVNHKMRAENKDPDVLDELIATSPKAKKVPAPIEIPKVEEPVDSEHMQKVESFQRMIKVGVPRHIVEIKAKSEGVEPSELDGRKDAAPNVTPSDDSDAIAPVMPTTRSRRSSISSVVSTAPSTPDALSTRSASNVASNNGRTLAMQALRRMNTGMRKKLHWSTTPYTGAIVPAQRRSDPAFFGSEQYEEENEPDPEVDGEQEMAAKDPGCAFLHRKLYVVLLDHKKSQNIAIVLARVKRTFSELTHEILTLNCDVLSSPALQSLIDMWPDSAEQEAIDQFDGDVSSLATAERFLMVARKIPRAQQKLRCLQFKMDFAPRVAELRANLKLLIRGIQQVCTSDRFAGVLEYIFHLGNLLNFGEGVEYTEWVKSISISSLSKLSFTKAYDGRISFLQYVIQSVERDEPHLALFSDQLPLIVKCSKLSVQSLVAEHQSLNSGLRMLINETQKAAVFKTDDVELREDLAESRESMRLYAMEVEQELNGVQELVSQLERERKHFLNYFEEEDTLPIDELLGYIASFAEEYSRERQQLILRARRVQKTNHMRSASVNTLPQKRHSL